MTRHLYSFTFFISLLSANFTYAAGATSYPFLKVPAAFKTVVDQNGVRDEILARNLPNPRDQKYLPICAAATAVFLIDAANCMDAMVDCKKVPDTNRASLLDLTRYGRMFDTKQIEDVDMLSRKSSPGIDLSYEGGQSVNVLLVGALMARNILRESVAPFEEIFARPGLSGDELITDGLSAMVELKNIYAAAKVKEAECGDECVKTFATQNLPRLRKLFQLKTSDDEIIDAFVNDKFYANDLKGKPINDSITKHRINFFSERLFIPLPPTNPREAMRILRPVSADIGDLKVFPEPGKPDTEYEAVMTKLKDAFKRNIPVSISGICVRNEKAKSDKDCFDLVKDSKTGKENRVSRLHAVAVGGYRRVCTAAKQCIDLLQVFNSWGPVFQNTYAHDGSEGWVDAKQLLNNAGYTEATYAWIDRAYWDTAETRALYGNPRK